MVVQRDESESRLICCCCCCCCCSAVWEELAFFPPNSFSQPSLKKVEVVTFSLPLYMSVHWYSYSQQVLNGLNLALLQNTHLYPKTGCDCMGGRRRGRGNPFQHSLMQRPPILGSMARGLSYGTQAAAGVAPLTPLLGTIMASSGSAPVLRPARRRFKLAILTVLSIHNPHQLPVKMKCRVGILCLCSRCPPHISSKDEKGIIVHCYISSSNDVAQIIQCPSCADPNHPARPFSIRQLSLWSIWNIQWANRFAQSLKYILIDIDDQTMPS